MVPVRGKPRVLIHDRESETRGKRDHEAGPGSIPGPTHMRPIPTAATESGRPEAKADFPIAPAPTHRSHDHEAEGTATKKKGRHPGRIAALFLALFTGREPCGGA